MNNLTTRKIVLGTLMALVLTFSVQGIADAQSVDVSGDGSTTSSSSGTKIVEGPTPVTRSFEIEVSGAEDGETIIINGTGSSDTVTITKITGADKLLGEGTLLTLPASAGASVTITVDAPGEENLNSDTLYQSFPLDFKTWNETDINDDGDTTTSDTADVNGDGDETDTRVTAVWEGDVGFSLNEDADQIDYLLRVSESIADKDLNADGDKTDTFTRDTTLYEEKADWRGSATLTVEYSVSAYGEYMVLIAGSIDSEVAGSPIRAYVVRSESEARFFTFADVSGNIKTTSPQIGAKTAAKEISVFTTEPWAKVEFKIIAGSGTLHSSGTNDYYYVGNRNLHRSLSSGSTTIIAYSEGTDNEARVLFQASRDTTATVRARIPGSVNPDGTHDVIIFFDSVTLERISGNEQFGQENSDSIDVENRPQLRNPLTVRVLDGTRGVGEKQGKVTFTVTVPSGNENGTLRYFSSSLFDPDATDSEQDTKSVTVYTDRQGNAKAYLVLGTSAAAHTVTATVDGQTGSVNFTATATPAVRGGQDLRINRDAGTTETPQRNAKFGTVNTPLRMSVEIVENDNSGADTTNVQVNFQINGGRIYLAPATLDLTEPDYQTSLTTVTNTSGIATVYVEVNNGATATVTAQIVGNNSPRGRHTVTYFWGDPNYDDDSGGGRSDPPPLPPPAVTNTITIVPSSIDGEPGEEIDISISSSPSTIVILDSGELDDADFSRLFGTTPFDVTIELPDEEDDYTFSATAPEFTTATATVTVEEEEVALGRLSIVAVGAPANGQQTIRITVRDSAGVLAVGAVSVTLTGTGVNRTVPTADGSGAAVIPVPNTVSVQAEGYRLATLTLTGTGQVDDTADDPVPPPAADTGGEPDSIEITGPAARSGTVNEELETALIVRVLDDDGDAVEDARVIFRVVSGRGRLSDRGNGRAVAVQTDSRGYARANFTPTDDGTITVRASTTDISATVEFTITTGAAPDTPTPGTGVTPSTPRTGVTISPVVHVAAASRPPMLWVDGGAIYALVDADVKEFAPSVDNALNIAVGGGKVYWTEKTGENSGTINSANLDGSDVTELVSVRSVPMGIAVDTAGRKLYWTASSGKIKRADLDGSGRENVVPGGLESPMDLALADGNVYWTQGNGSVRFANLTGRIHVLTPYFHRFGYPRKPRDRWR